MEKGLSYFEIAENDYQFLLFDRKAGRVGNLMCSAAQNICEWYLKHIIDTYVLDIDTTSILKTHSLKALRRFVLSEVPDFKGDWKIILQADGYYFSARYPGDGAFIVGKEDVDECWDAVEETRSATLQYIQQKELTKKGEQDISRTPDVPEKKKAKIR